MKMRKKIEGINRVSSGCILNHRQGHGQSHESGHSIIRSLGIGLSVSLVFALCPIETLAGSPEFAYSADKWSSLRDDTLEYGEIGDLIHEYNHTVLQNQIDYEEYRGETRDEISDDYYDAADEIEGNLYYPDADDSNYSSSISSYLNGQIQANDLREQGDDNVDDGDSKKLAYDQTEAKLVKEAQELLITYWSQTWSLQSLEKAEEQAEAAYTTALAKREAGTVTQAEVLSAQEAVTSAKAAYSSAVSSQTQTRDSLCLMLGWTYGSEVDLGEVPEPDMEAIGAIQLAGDVEAGVNANYELKILERKIENASSTTNKDSLKQEYQSQKETAASGIKNAYETLLLSKEDYDQAVQADEVETQGLETAARKLAAGTITQKDYDKQQAASVTSSVAVQTQKLELVKAQLEYQWAVNGLAAVS